VHHTVFGNAKFAGPNLGNAARHLWVGGSTEGRSRNSSHEIDLRNHEAVAALGGGIASTKNWINEVRRTKIGHGAEVTVAGGRLIGGLRAVNRAEGGLSGAFIGCAAGGEKIGDSDSGDNADNRYNDQKFD
jgi:hypothetical protein